MRHLLAALLLLPTAAAAQTDGSATAAVASRAASIPSADACRAQAAAFLLQIPQEARIPIPPPPFDHVQEGSTGALVLVCRTDGTGWRFTGTWRSP
jgi:hypothetical protein